MIFKLVVNFKAGDTWETIFVYQRHRRLERKKSDPPVPLLKQRFLKIIILHQTNIPVRSDPIRSAVRSDPEFDPIRNPIQILLAATIKKRSSPPCLLVSRTNKSRDLWSKNARLSPNQGEVKAVKFWYSPTGRFKKLMANLRISPTLRSKISTIRGGFGGRGFNSLVHSV